MALHLARIHGTEEDRVNCPFYYKIGACRHGDRCSRLHHKPAFSQTLLFKHLYQHPVRLAEIQQAAGATGKVNEEEALEDFLCFFEDMYMELSKCGKIEGVRQKSNQIPLLLFFTLRLYPLTFENFLCLCSCTFPIISAIT